MAKIDFNFLGLCHAIIDRGYEYENANRSVKRLQIPSYTFRHDMADGFPAISIKELPFKMIIGELIWFLRGDNDIKYLNDNGIKIWNKDAYNWYVKDMGENYPEAEQLTLNAFSHIGKGSVGANYSVMWRDFDGVDQIMRLICDMEKDIMSSRMKVNAWNPAKIFDTALPPCHSEFQVIGVPLTREQRIKLSNVNWNDNVATEELDRAGEPTHGFELHWNQRSVDTFLGLPFNIASYGALALILEAITGHKALAIVGTLKCVHFYDNQYDAVEKQLLMRDPYRNDKCELKISKEGITVLENKTDRDNMFEMLQIEHFDLEGYEHQGAIKVEMLAPNKL